MDFFVGLDIGGTNIAVALVSNEGVVVKKLTMPTQASKGQKIVISNIKRIISYIINDKVKGVGVGCPGPLRLPDGVMINPVNLPLKNFKIKSVIEKEFGVPVVVCNDANCFVLGEATFGRAKNCKTVVGLTLGTGVGGGIVINKEIIHGASNAGEFGACSIKFDGVKGKHGNLGEVEDYLSARGIMKLAKGLKAKTPLDVYNLAVKGNKNALNVFEEYGRLLGFVITNLIFTFDPEAIVIGGNIAKASKFFNKSMLAEVKKRTMYNNAMIYASEDSERFAILGAVYPFMRK